jgi:hypothetical protein
MSCRFNFSRPYVAVIPAKAEALHNSEAGQSMLLFGEKRKMDSRFRGNDGSRSEGISHISLVHGKG